MSVARAESPHSGASLVCLIGLFLAMGGCLPGDPLEASPEALDALQPPEVSQPGPVVAGTQTIAFDVTPSEIELDESSDASVLLVSYVGPATLSYRVSWDADYIQVSPPSGLISDGEVSLQISVDRSGLGPGLHEATIRIEPDGLEAIEVPVRVTVPDSVTPGETQSGGVQNGPTISLSTTQLDFDLDQDTLSVLFRYLGEGEVGYQVRTTARWISPSTTTGTNAGEYDEIVISVDRSGLEAGTHADSVVIEVDNGESVRLGVSVLVAEGDIIPAPPLEDPIVYASDFGFDSADATEAIQGALDSGARTVVIDNVGADWNIRPILLRSSQIVVFEPGVTVVAKRGEFLDPSDQMFRAPRRNDVTLWGYGATLRMWKEDYLGSDYPSSQWRHAVSIIAASNIHIAGLRIESAGGDGVYIGPQVVDGVLVPSRSVLIEDVVCDDNLRQGLSITGAEGVLVRNCEFSRCSGSGPQAGVDIEPNLEEDVLAGIRLVNCVARDCRLGFAVALDRLSATSQPVSISIENCQAVDSRATGIIVDSGLHPPGGTIDFRDCLVDGTGGTGTAVFWRTHSNLRLDFENCLWQNAAADPERFPIRMEMPHVTAVSDPGSIEFLACQVWDNVDRRPVKVVDPSLGSGVFNLIGSVDVFNAVETVWNWWEGPEYPAFELHYPDR